MNKHLQSTVAGRFIHDYSGLILLAAVAAFLASMPFWAGRGDMRTVQEFMYFLALAQMWNLLAGYGGLISIGQQAFVGVGGYSLFVFALFWGIDPFLSIALAGLVAALVSIPSAALLFRLRGAYFAIGTWVVAEVLRLLVLNTSALGGGSGMTLTRALVRMPRAYRESMTFWIALALGIGSILAAYLILRSRHGLALTALRDSEAAAESVGIRVPIVRWAVYIGAAFGCGMIGALIYLMNLRISPDAAFGIEWTAYVIFIVVIGGIGTIEGPIIGTLVFFALRQTLGDYGSLYLIVLGVLAIAVMITTRGGAWGYVAQRFGLFLFPVRRRAPARNPDEQVDQRPSEQSNT